MNDFFERMVAGSEITLCWTGNDGWITCSSPMNMAIISIRILAVFSMKKRLPFRIA